jgi:hypothetical protein
VEETEGLVTADELCRRLTETKAVAADDMIELSELVEANAAVKSAGDSLQKAKERWQLAVAAFLEMQP